MSTTDEVHFVTAGDDRLRIHVRPGIGGTGILLVIANGIGSSLEILQPFVDALPADIEVVRFDVPGVGGTAPPNRPYRFAGLARILRRSLDTLGYQTVDMLGVSWGGGIAQQLAILRNGRCRRLVLASTATGAIMVPGSPRVLAVMATSRRYRDLAYARRIAGTIYGGAVRDDPDPAVRLLATATNGSGASRSYMMQLLAIATWTSLPWLCRIRQPTLILAGDDDPLVPLINARIMAALIPNARLHVYHDGHIALITDPVVYGPLIADFLENPATAATARPPSGHPR